VARLADLGPLDIRQVRRTPEETLVKSLVEQPRPRSGNGSAVVSGAQR